MDDMAFAYETHLWSSAVPSTWQSELLLLMGGKTKENSEMLATSLTNIGEIASADVIQSLEKIADALIAEKAEDRMLDEQSSDEDKLGWLLSPAAGRVVPLFQHFLKQHGHRCFREAEMRQKGWGEDATPVIGMLVASLRARGMLVGEKPPEKIDFEFERRAHARVEEKARGSMNFLSRPIFHMGLRFAKSGVRKREQTKYLTIRLQNSIKRDYRLLARKLWQKGALRTNQGKTPSQIEEDLDLIFFLTHEEIGVLMQAASQRRDTPHNRKLAATLLQKARQRREVLPLQEAIEFPHLSEPGEPPFPKRKHEGDADEEERRVEGRVEGEGLVLKGMGVSKGVVVSRARVIRKIHEASSLKKGEILIVPYTDVGWTPFFSLVGVYLLSSLPPLSLSLIYFCRRSCMRARWGGIAWGCCCARVWTALCGGFTRCDVVIQHRGYRQIRWQHRFPLLAKGCLIETEICRTWIVVSIDRFIRVSNFLCYVNRLLASRCSKSRYCAST